MGKIKKNRLLSNNEGNIMIIALALLFVYFATRLLTTEGNTHPLVNSLFDMIVIIAILMVIFHKRDIQESKKSVLKQMTLDSYLHKL